jgi:hypothetical protein
MTYINATLLGGKFDQERELLHSGMSYQAIASLTGERVGTLKERNRLVYKIDIYEAFRQHVEREGIPNRLSVSNDFGNYFAGFFDGEGCIVAFHRRRTDRPKSYPEFRLSLQIAIRDDDLQVLEYIRDNLGGRIHRQKARKYTQTNPSARWNLESIKDLAEVVIPLLEKYPLRSKKGREYEIWKPLVIQRYIATLGGETARGGSTSDEFEKDFVLAVSGISAIRNYSNGV